MGRPFPEIAEILRSSRFTVQKLTSAKTLKKMLDDFSTRTRGGQEVFTVAIVEEEVGGRGREDQAQLHGIVFLKPGEKAGIFTGIHYLPGDCGTNSPSVRATIKMLSEHFKLPESEVRGVMFAYPRVIVERDTSGNSTIEPA